MDLTGKPFQASDQKKNKKISTLHKKNSWAQGFWKQQINISPANSTN